MTVTDPTAFGYVTVFPSGVSRPTASNLNFVPGQTIPNLVMVGIGSAGRISIFNSAGATHVLADIVGYYSPTGSAFLSVTPLRLMDTRIGVGSPTAPIGPAASRDLVVRGGATGIPASATAVVVNLTATGPTAAGYLTAYPSNVAAPLASNLNFVAGETIPNLVLVGIGPDGRIKILNSAGTTDVVVDIVGFTT
jgi:hypothetical protein